MGKTEITKKLAEFVVKTEYNDLPKEAVESAKMMILDTLGCGIAGTVLSREEVAPVIKITEELGGNEDCTLIVSRNKTSWFNAILVNGTFMHSIDFDDTRPGPLTHTGSIVVSPILAFGEMLGSSGKETLLATVLAYEIVYRIGNCVMPSHYQFWHSTGTNGTFGGAVAAGKLLGLNVEQIEKALGIAADQASGLISCIEFGDLTKSLHAGLTSAKGALAAMLVKNGATGPQGILEYPRGYCNAYSKEPKMEEITRNLGKSFDIVNNCPKFFPSVLASHCAIQATLKLVRENNITLDDVQGVKVSTYNTAATTFSNKEPSTKLAARLSVPYCIAVAILDRELGMRQFDEDRFHDRRIRETIKRVSLEGDQELEKLYPEAFPARVEIVTKNGRAFSAEEHYPKGFPRNPLFVEELEHKFESLCANVFDQGRIRELKEKINQMESLENISGMIQLLVKE